MKTPALAALLSLAGSLHASTVVYTQGFETELIGPEWSGAGSLVSSEGLNAFGFGFAHLHNNTTNATALNLLGLAAHTNVTLTFDLAMWDSIDLGGDRFVITAGGVTLYDNFQDFGNYFPADNLGHGPGTNLTAAFTDFTTPQYGQNTGFRDSARHVSFTFDHTAADLTVTWQFPNSQGGTDESFGVDNVEISVTPVPEPSAAAGLLLAAVVLSTRRRRAV